MGLNLSQFYAPTSLGIRVRRVALKALSTPLLLLDSSTISSTSSLTKSQKWWNKFEVKPSNPGAFPRAIWWITSSTSCIATGLRIISLFSLVMVLGIRSVILVMSLLLSPPLSLRILEKWWVRSSSISLQVSTLLPSEFLNLCILELFLF